MTRRQTWDLGRLIKTVTYFDSFPLLRFFPCLKQIILDPKDIVNQAPKTPPIGTILVMNAPASPGKPLIQALLNQNFPVRVWHCEVTPEDFKQPIEVAADSFSPQTLHYVQSVIYFDNGEDFRGFLQSSVQQLGTDAATLLFDFSQTTEDLRQTWGAVDDVVMGGVSESGIRLLDEKAVFTGNVSTANSGGFASVRNRNFDPPLDLSDYQGIELRVKGDGKRYKFITRCEGRWDGVSYCYSFDTVASEWITVRIPFDSLIPVFRAKTLQDVGAFDTSSVYSLQLMLSKFEYDGGLNPTFEPGFFALEIQSISVYGGSETCKFIWVGSQPPEASQRANLEMSDLPYGVVVEDSGSAIAQQCLQLLL